MRDALGQFEHSQPSRLFIDPDDPTHVSVPLFPPVGVERDRVLDGLFEQLVDIYRAVEAVPAPKAAVQQPPPEATE